MELPNALKMIEAKLQEYKGKNKGATILVLQSDLSATNLQFMGLPSLVNDFPIVKCPIVAGDNEFPAIDWLRYATKNMTSRFTEVGEWLSAQRNFALYTIMPLCNLEADAESFVIDTLYARQLNQQKHMLWYSDSCLPDLGGHEDRNFRAYFQDTIENPEIVHKGFYRTYSVEVNISELALNTILCYDQSPDYIQLEEHLRQDSKQKHRQNQG